MGSRHKQIKMIKVAKIVKHVRVVRGPIGRWGTGGASAVFIGWSGSGCLRKAPVIDGKEPAVCRSGQRAVSHRDSTCKGPEAGSGW